MTADELPCRVLARQASRRDESSRTVGLLSGSFPSSGTMCVPYLAICKAESTEPLLAPLATVSQQQ